MAASSLRTSLKFRRVLVRARTATVTITDDAAGSPQSVSLTGTGVTLRPQPLAAHSAISAWASPPTDFTFEKKFPEQFQMTADLFIVGDGTLVALKALSMSSTRVNMSWRTASCCSSIELQWCGFPSTLGLPTPATEHVFWNDQERRDRADGWGGMQYQRELALLTSSSPGVF